MSAKKNLTAKELSEKFGFQVSDKDLEPEIDKDSKFLNQMADLSQLIDANEKKTPPPAEEKQPEAEPEKEQTFAELFEARGAVTESAQPDKKQAPAEKKKSKLVDLNDSNDFSAYFNLASAKVEDKDQVTLRDEDYEPFEVSEEDLEDKKNVSFHGFDDLAKAFGGKKRK